MIPANHRSMARVASHARICTAALYSVPGVCTCPRCAPEIDQPPASGDCDPPEAAAAPICDPTAAGGGTPFPGTACDPVPGSPAADRSFPPTQPVGGPFDPFSDGPDPAPEYSAAAPTLAPSPTGGGLSLHLDRSIDQ